MKKSKSETASFLTKEELFELKYCINKELAWKRQNLLQLQKGVASTVEKLPEELREKGKTQEEWLKEKIAILEKMQSKVKALLTEKKLQNKNEKALEILNTVDPEKD